MKRTRIILFVVSLAMIAAGVATLNRPPPPKSAWVDAWPDCTLEVSWSPCVAGLCDDVAAETLLLRWGVVNCEVRWSKGEWQEVPRATVVAWVAELERLSAEAAVKRRAKRRLARSYIVTSWGGSCEPAVFFEVGRPEIHLSDFRDGDWSELIDDALKGPGARMEKLYTQLSRAAGPRP
ncbi:MAG: hypothetical protein U0228_39330 [Myxococcaceae bacterium]